MDTALHRALLAFAARPRVLIGVDFDGTLAPLVDEPMSARALPGALDLLVELASLPGVSVAVVSGRDLATLDRLTQLVGSVVLVGSHGAESSRTGGAELDEEAGRRFAALDGDLQ
nr:trehalose-phosphatase [Actinomycetota bacterium]